MPKVYIKTFGCQMNMRDSEYVAGILLDRGFRLARDSEHADVILFNSCSVRKHAEDRLFGNISQLKKLKHKRPSLVVGLIGCTAQSYAHEAIRRTPLIDIVCGTGNEADLPDMIEDFLEHRCEVVATDKVNLPRAELFPKYREGSFKAYVSIGEGCNNFCSYCIVPYVRGRERSRELKDIVREARDLAERGFKEITLLGQNVNSYGKNIREFLQLLEKINSIDGIKRIRFMTSHPKDASIDLFKAMAGLDKVCEHLHLPLQSGSDRVLKLMNRGYTAKKYRKLIDDYRKVLPEGSVTTDIIVGFTQETQIDFTKTAKMMKEVGFDSAYTFKYSPRPPAKSAKLKDNVQPETKNSRLAKINAIGSEGALVCNRAFEGKLVEILVDGVNTQDASRLSGRTRENKIVVFKGPANLVGKFVKVVIESVTPYAMKGRIV